jgi:pimeloyl-ACP methyl ester carboxylesterase
MKTVTSADGTTIAVETTGTGRPVILIGGAFNDRSTVAALAATLAPQLTVLTYDRRGRGASGPIGPWTSEAADREIEDLAAVIELAGGTADLFGHSSGAVLALEATQRGLPVGRVAVYEPSYVTAESVRNGWQARPPAGLADRIAALAGADQRDQAVEMFLTEAAAVPAEMVAGMRASGMWGWFTGLAHTLPYDVALGGPGLALPAERFAQISAPVLAIGGSQSPPWLPAAARAVADVVPGARYTTLDGQDHGVLNQPESLLPLLTAFYLGPQ